MRACLRLESRVSNLDERNERSKREGEKRKRKKGRSKEKWSINLEKITPLLKFPISIKRKRKEKKERRVALVFEEKPLPWCPRKRVLGREKTASPVGLIRIRLDPIYSQLTERDVEIVAVSIVSISRPGEGIPFAGNWSRQPRYFDLIQPVFSDKYPMADQSWTISNREWLNFSFLLEIGRRAGVRDSLVSNAKEKRGNTAI